MFYKIVSCLFFVVSLTSLSSAQSDGKTLATVGGLTISEREFKTRFELSPFLSHKSGWNQDSLKSDFLYSLIAEKLWYLEAKNQGFETNENFRFYFKPLEDIFLRDALFKIEVESKVKLSPYDVNNTLYKAGFTLKSVMISSTDSSLISKFYSSLETIKFVKIDSLLKSSPFNLLVSNPVEIKLGLLQDEEIEDSLYSLKPGKFTKPIKSDAGWVLFFIDEYISTPVDPGNQKETDQLKQVVKDRRAFHKTKEFLRNLLGTSIINIDEETFKLIAEAVYKVISKSEFNFDGENEFSYVLSSIDYNSIKSSLGSENLARPLFLVNDKKITIWDFLAQLAFEEHEFGSKKKEAIFQKLNKLVKEFVQQQVLTYEAEKRGLKSLKTVIDELESWKQNLLAQIMKVSFLDSARVSDSEIEDYYREDVLKDKDFLLVNLQLLTVKDLNEIEVVLNETGKGKTFGEILKSYGQTDPLVNEHGETGLKPAVFLGDIGIIASKLDLNQLYGPIKRGDGYSLLMVTEKSNMNDSLKFEYQSSKEQLRTYLFQKKLNSFLSNKTMGLAQKHNTKVFESHLKEIKTTGIVMFVHRLMGFGGRITGVPLLDNWADFIDINRLKQELIP